MDYSNTHLKTLMTYQCILDIPLILLKEKTNIKVVVVMKVSHYNLPLYKYIRDQGHWYNRDMILIETKYCEKVIEVKKYERELIDLMKPKLNISRPFVTDNDLKEYRQHCCQENIDTIKPKRQIYRDNHKGQISIRKNIYRENNKEKVANGKKKKTKSKTI